METYNFTYEELKKKIVQARKRHFLDNLASSTFIRESMIVTYTRRNLGVVVASKLTLASATMSNTKYLMEENKQLAKNLQVAR